MERGLNGRQGLGLLQVQRRQLACCCRVLGWCLRQAFDWAACVVHEVVALDRLGVALGLGLQVGRDRITREVGGAEDDATAAVAYERLLVMYDVTLLLLLGVTPSRGISARKRRAACHILTSGNGRCLRLRN